MKDKLGQEIKEGDIIAYGHLLGRCAGLRVGKVLSVSTTRMMQYGYEEEVNQIVVMGIEDDYLSFKVKPKLCSRKGTLHYPNRIVVLKEDQISPQYKELLDTV